MNQKELNPKYTNWPTWQLEQLFEHLNEHPEVLTEKDRDTLVEVGIEIATREWNEQNVQ